MGSVFGRYYLLGRLATGGMAEVFLGKRLHDSDELLAIKRMLPALSGDPDFVSMFTDEARIVSGLTHPNICRVYEHGQHDNQLYLAMEFIHGKDLAVVQHRANERGEPTPPRLVAFLVAKIAEALDYAHHKENESGQSEGIVHRDISPQNILISYEGVPKLIDFGVAKALHRAAQTRVGMVKGKLAYMAPEQATAKTVDGRADVFSLGVVLYQMLTGELPFKGASDGNIVRTAGRGVYRPPQEINPAVTRHMAAVVERALAYDLAQRYGRAGELAQELHAVLAEEERETTEIVLSSWLRRLFRDDYIREVTRLRSLAAAGAQAAGQQGEPVVPQPGSSEETSTDQAEQHAAWATPAPRLAPSSSSGSHRTVAPNSAAAPAAPTASSGSHRAVAPKTDAAPRPGFQDVKTAEMAVPRELAALAGAPRPAELDPVREPTREAELQAELVDVSPGGDEQNGSMELPDDAWTEDAADLAPSTGIIHLQTALRGDAGSGADELPEELVDDRPATEPQPTRQELPTKLERAPVQLTEPPIAELSSPILASSASTARGSAPIVLEAKDEERAVTLSADVPVVQEAPLFTGVQISILLVAALLGLLLVGGSYWYASTKQLEQPSIAQPIGP